MSVEAIFPQVLYKTKIRDYEKYNAQIENRLKFIKNEVPPGGANWIGYVYNTCGTFEIHTDPELKELSNLITKHVNWFAADLGVVSGFRYVPEQSWANIYNQDGYQEFHYHGGFSFSAVYYAKTTENTQIIFENPVQDMIPLPTSMNTQLTSTMKTYRPEAGDLIIFRSHLRHSVPPHKDKDERITLAFNYKEEKINEWSL